MPARLQAIKKQNSGILLQRIPQQLHRLGGKQTQQGTQRVCRKLLGLNRCFFEISLPRCDFCSRSFQSSFAAQNAQYYHANDKAAFFHPTSPQIV